MVAWSSSIPCSREMSSTPTMISPCKMSSEWYTDKHLQHPCGVRRQREGSIRCLNLTKENEAAADASPVIMSAGGSPHLDLLHATAVFLCPSKVLENCLMLSWNPQIYLLLGFANQT